MSRPTPVTREKPPCSGCTEKFTACHDRCPKDERGEAGYKAWKSQLEETNKRRKEYEAKPFVKYNPFNY
jgi:hypothetical protein